MSLTVIVEIDVQPAPGQSQAEAEAQIAQSFANHVSHPEGAFMSDYGVDTWGGYDGPLVRSVRTGDSLITVTPARTAVAA